MHWEECLMTPAGRQVPSGGVYFGVILLVTSVQEVQSRGLGDFLLQSLEK